MTVYTATEARKRLSRVLDEAERDGGVRIRREDGREYALRPVESTASPFDVEGASLDLTSDEIVQAVRDGRARSDA